MYMNIGDLNVSIINEALDKQDATKKASDKLKELARTLSAIDSNILFTYDGWTKTYKLPKGTVTVPDTSEVPF